jgi:hypothetical protein
MHHYKVTLEIYWKDTSITHEVVDAITIKPYEDYLEIYGQTILINYEESLSDELLDNLDRVTITDVTLSLVSPYSG